jgi:hypothetical protein
MSTERAPEYQSEEPEDSGLKRRSATLGLSLAPEERQEVTSIFTAFGLEDAPSTIRPTAQAAETDSTLVRLGISAMVTIISAAVWVAIMPDSAPKPDLAAGPSAAMVAAEGPTTSASELAPEAESSAASSSSPAFLPPSPTEAHARGTAAKAAGRPKPKQARARVQATVSSPARPPTPFNERSLSSDPYGEASIPAARSRPTPRVTGVVQDNPY